MEPRGCIAEWDDHLGRFTLYVGTQRPHTARADMARRILHIPETQLRVVAGEVGGSFGMKGAHYPEYALALWASRKVGRPIKWIAERGESMLDLEPAKRRKGAARCSKLPQYRVRRAHPASPARCARWSPACRGF